MIHLALIALVSLSSFEQSLVNRLSGPRMMRDLKEITQYDRISGGAGEARSVDYIVNQLRQSGIAVQVHEFESLLSWPGAASLEIRGQRPERLEAVTFAFGTSTPAEGIEGDLVVAEMTGAAELAGNATIRPQDLKGKIVLVDELPYPHIARQLEAAGALAGIFSSNGERFNEMVTTTVWGTPSTANAHLIPKLSGVTLRRADVRTLQTRLARQRLRVRLKTAVDTQWRKVRLPVATIPGGVNDHFVLIGSHIDSWHQGGTDAGASNVIALELARAFQAAKDSGELERTIKIAWWPGHSTGRYSGSAWYADHQFSELDRGAIAHINMDGLGALGARQYSTQNSAELDALARQVLRDAVESEGKSTRPNRNSDQSFLGIGISSLQIDDTVPADAGGYWWWHTTEDTFDKADERVALRDAGAVAVAVSRLIQPRIIPFQFLDVTREIESRIQQLQQIAGPHFSLNDALEACYRLEFAIKEMNRNLENEIPNTRLRTINDRLIQLTRWINPLIYTIGGRYHPDDANPKSLIPGLANVGRLSQLQGDALRFEVTFLTRERNRLVDALDRASATASTIR